jgi:hypothetical protein
MIDLLQATVNSPGTTSASYLPIGLQVLFVVGLVVFTMLPSGKSLCSDVIISIIA